MNKQRRAEVERARAMIDEAKDILEAVNSDEQSAFESLPDSLQGGDRGQRMQEAIDALDTIVGDIDGWDFEAILA